jgi:hypothetical protein
MEIEVLFERSFSFQVAEVVTTNSILSNILSIIFNILGLYY